MAGRWWNVYAKPIRDALVTVITARKTADALSVAEIKAGLHANVARFPANGIYILPPGKRRTVDLNEGVSAGVTEELVYPAVCVKRGMTEADQLDGLGELVGLIHDAIENKVTLDNQAGVVTAYVDDVTEPEPHGEGTAQYLAVQVVFIAVQIFRTGVA